MPTYLATVIESRTTGGLLLGGSIAVDETRDGSVIDSPWSHGMTEEEAESREWDAILAAGGWTVVGDWTDHDGLFTATVERA